MTILTGIGCSLNPTDRVEAGLMLFMLVGGVFAYAVILGNVYSIMQNVGQDERDFRKHIESLMNFLDYRQVKDKELKQKIVGHFNRVWQKSKGIEEDAMLRSLGRPLRLDGEGQPTRTHTELAAGTFSHFASIEDACARRAEKNVLKASSPPPMVLSDGICPSG